MQVNNKFQSPNFGMSLIIKKSPQVAKGLEQLPEKALNNIIEAGRELANTKTYHALIDDEGIKIVSKPDAYFAPGVTSKMKMDYGHYINVLGNKKEDKGILVGRDLAHDVSNWGIHKLGISTEDGLTQYASWGLLHNYKNYEEISMIVPIVKTMEELHDAKVIEKTNMMEMAKALVEKTKHKVDDLFAKYGK